MFRSQISWKELWSITRNTIEIIFHHPLVAAGALSLETFIYWSVGPVYNFLMASVLTLAYLCFHTQGDLKDLGTILKEQKRLLTASALVTVVMFISFTAVLYFGDTTAPDESYNITTPTVAAVLLSSPFIAVTGMLSVFIVSLFAVLPASLYYDIFHITLTAMLRFIIDNAMKFLLVSAVLFGTPQLLLQQNAIGHAASAVVQHIFMAALFCAMFNIDKKKRKQSAKQSSKASLKKLTTSSSLT